MKYIAFVILACLVIPVVLVRMAIALGGPEVRALLGVVPAR
jgi:hypothetical protein